MLDKHKDVLETLDGQKTERKLTFEIMTVTS